MKHLTPESIQVAGAIGTLVVTGVIGGLLVKLSKNYYDGIIKEYKKHFGDLKERS